MSRFEINSHTHIFNFSSVFTEKTLSILLRRLTKEKLGDFDGRLQNALSKKLSQLIRPYLAEAGKVVDPNTLIKKWLSDLKLDEKFNALLKEQWPQAKTQIEILNKEELWNLGAGVLSDILADMWKDISMKNDVREAGLLDMIAFLYIGLQPSIAKVVSILLAQTPKDSGLVALTMDVGGEDDADRAVIAEQFRDTAEMVLHYPGRVLPFVAVNPLIDNFPLIMSKALEEQGFVGVKLYPSLGYNISLNQKPSKQMLEICQYCQDTQTPIMCHCTKGGFYRSKRDIIRSRPMHWKPLMEEFPDLKVCFGHFGGGETMLDRPMHTGAAAQNWTEEIRTLMREHEGVYADISHHNDPMLADDPAKENNYFANLKEMLSISPYQDRILYGSDFSLVRRIARDDSYRKYFVDHLDDPALFDKMAVENPARYLGLPVQGAAMGKNISRYLDHILKNSSKCRSQPPAWLVAAIAASGQEVPKFRNRDWDHANPAHRYLFFHLGKKGMISGSDGSSGFENYADYLLSDLIGHHRWQGSDERIKERSKDFAIILDKYLTDWQPEYQYATYEEGWLSADKRVDAIVKLYNQQGALLSELATLVDTIYRYFDE
jgi:predicted TIM-barrel fold metal-dependent hydrolase